ncbi:UNVERIFIED_CONTAM: hypothetical protein H355_014247 [Colinus virginianus]|nr:hypothetical protein H355_014247 [Colinus virginianus]
MTCPLSQLPQSQRVVLVRQNQRLRQLQQQHSKRADKAAPPRMHQLEGTQAWQSQLDGADVTQTHLPENVAVQRQQHYQETRKLRLPHEGDKSPFQQRMFEGKDTGLVVPHHTANITGSLGSSGTASGNSRRCSLIARDKEVSALHPHAANSGVTYTAGPRLTARSTPTELQEPLTHSKGQQQQQQPRKEEPQEKQGQQVLKKEQWQPATTRQQPHNTSSKPYPLQRSLLADSRSTGGFGHYVFGETLGEGTFGKVKLGLHAATQEAVAVKILDKQKIQEANDVERVMREIHILKILRHPHIVQLLEIIETQHHLYLVMEYASGGELYDYIVQHQHVDERQACSFFRQILAGVEEMHKLRICHRRVSGPVMQQYMDLKPENILLDESRNIKIVDFGLSNTYRRSDSLLTTACGSPSYAAPEMIEGKAYQPLMKIGDRSSSSTGRNGAGPPDKCSSYQHKSSSSKTLGHCCYRRFFVFVLYSGDSRPRQQLAVRYCIAT